MSVQRCPINPRISILTAGFFDSTPPQIAGVVGAIFNVSLQLGLALGVAILTSIKTSIDNNRIARGEHPGYAGVADGYWFVFAWVATTAILFSIFYKIHKPTDPEAGEDRGSEMTDGTRIEVQADKT